MTSVADMVFLGLLGAALHYAAYRAVATHWLWSRYPKPVNALLSCSACSGFWLGGALGALARARSYALLGLSPNDWLLLPACALVCMVTAPIFSYLMVYALTALGGDDAQED